MTLYRDLDVIRLQEHLKALRLPTIQAECAQSAQECLREGVDHLGFLLKLCELELGATRLNARSKFMLLQEVASGPCSEFEEHDLGEVSRCAPLGPTP